MVSHWELAASPYGYPVCGGPACAGMPAITSDSTAPQTAVAS
ncbi:hypothetical protein SRIMM317S_00906 [Streptomyces rimosus subsp. rimosus]